MKAAWTLASLLAALSAAGPAGANHDWIGLDLCRAYPERMPRPWTLPSCPTLGAPAPIYSANTAISATRPRGRASTPPTNGPMSWRTWNC